MGVKQVDLIKMQEGGMDAAFFVVFVPQTERTEANYKIAKSQAQIPNFLPFAAWRRTCIRTKSSWRLPPMMCGVSMTDGKRIALIGIENGYTIGKDLSLLKTYYDLGARYMSLTHNGHNDLADSCCVMPNLGDEESEHDGLSPLGASGRGRNESLGHHGRCGPCRQANRA